MKRITMSLTALALAGTMLAGCAGATAPADTQTTGEQTAAASDTQSTQEAAVQSAPLPVADNAVAFAASLGLGWNLGNTLDATGAEDLTSETSWGQPKAEKALFEYLKSQGISSVRIPVSWGQHTDADYNIDPDWMARVTEVVDYAMDSGLYVIINSHHDCDKYYPSDEHADESERYIKAVWTQIADNFADYDNSLIFESMNEPRLMGTSIEWWFRDDDEKGIASIKVINRLNQAFVDTVRASGGNNPTRYLMVPSNAAAPQNATNPAFVMPEDPANKLMVSVHAYTPYDFAGKADGYSDWSDDKLFELNFMDGLNTKFIKNGYGVVIGEFGATNKDNLDDRVAWAKDYVGKASSLGIPCFLWDNGGTEVGEENFGMIDRTNLKVYYPEILTAMVECYTSNEAKQAA